MAEISIDQKYFDELKRNADFYQLLLSSTDLEELEKGGPIYFSHISSYGPNAIIPVIDSDKDEVSERIFQLLEGINGFDEMRLKIGRISAKKTIEKLLGTKIPVKLGSSTLAYAQINFQNP